MSCHESSDACCSPACRAKAAYLIGAIVVFLLGWAINRELKHATETGARAAREARAKERAKTLAEIRQSTALELNSAATLDKTKGDTDGTKLVDAMKGLSWVSPRGPMSIDPETRDVTQNVYVREVKKVDGQLYNVEFATIPNVKGSN